MGQGKNFNMEKDKHTASLEHSRLLILERIDYLKPYIAHLELCRASKEVIVNMAVLKQELAGHEQGLKALDSHYALLEALKEAKDTLVMASLIDKSNTCDKAVKKIEDVIKQCGQ